MSKITLQSRNAVAETLLIPLHFRAQETRRPDALVKDEQAVGLVRQLDYDFSRIRLRKHDEVAIILRLREFDRFARDFLSRCPDGVVVHIGCGLDTRFQRVDNGRVEWYDLDLPEVVELRRTLIGDDAPCSGHPESIRHLPLPVGRSDSNDAEGAVNGLELWAGRLGGVAGLATLALAIQHMLASVRRDRTRHRL